VTLAERGGETYQGSIARTARAIDTVTRTMQVEIRVPNPKGELIAGSYVQVLLPIKGDNSGMVVPTNALLFRPSGTYIAVVDQSAHVRLAQVKLGTDFGTEVEVLGGLEPDTRFIINPSDSLADGDAVSLAAPAPTPVASDRN
jgi:multidrug efflux pump subunit AcrA (membrane-fusion protein)